MHPRAADYLAYTHVTGWRPTHMRIGASWSTTVILGVNVHPTKPSWVVDEKHHAELADHPFVRLYAKYKDLGFTIIDRSNWKKRLVSRGIPMMNDDTGQEISIMPDGKVRQHRAPGGKFEWRENIEAERHGAPYGTFTIITDGE